MSMVNEPNRPVDHQTATISPKMIIAGVIAIVALLFIFQNTGTGHFHFLFFDFTAPVWVWLLVVFGAGVATGLLIARRRAQRRAANA